MDQQATFYQRMDMLVNGIMNRITERNKDYQALSRQ